MSRASCLTILLIALAKAGTAQGACNVIPASDRTFPSTLGDVSTPFAQPGQEVTVQRDSNVFAQDPAQNLVTLEFHPPSGPTTTLAVAALAPESGSRCAPAQCTAGTCTCLRFSFPDTDAAVGTPQDDHGLTGPVSIIVTTAGHETARIDALRLPSSSLIDDLFPSFVGLPRPNPFLALTQGPGGDLLAAPDASGDLFIPFDFATLVSSDEAQTRFIDVTAPGTVPLVSLDLKAFTQEGQRLPPLLRASTSGVLATVDSPRSVLRVAGAPPGPLLTQEQGIGPVVVPGITGQGNPRKRGDAITLHATDRWTIYENRECGVQDPR